MVAVRITEALKIVQNAPGEGSAYDVVLACGFTPLHLETFLAAHLQQNLPGRRVTIRTGPYGDLGGTLEAVGSHPAHAVAIALEWADLDPRLGYRSSGSWGPASTRDIMASARTASERIALAVESIPDGIAAAVALPTLPLPPMFHAPGWQYGAAELELQQFVLAFASRMARRAGCSVASASRLAEISPWENRLDLKSDLAAGLPYSVAHASAMGETLARLLAPPPAKKGLITDLDDTLWHGLAGEAGPQGVSWDLASHHQLHGLYQKLLGAFAEEGVLLGVASKNDPDIVRRVFQRDDLLLDAGKVFPIEVHWNAKSGSVDRILRTWNISADSVVFIDDSPMELAEVAAAHPGMECLWFPKDDPAAADALLRRLRDLFGKPRISEEDSIRVDSIRQSAAVRDIGGNGAAAEAFLSQADALVSFDFENPGGDPRVLELVNKTNQFNLNGIRYADADWRARLSGPDAILAAVSYRDKFGPLGKIAVIQGAQKNASLHIGAWVMSCRAFSRRIEHQCLKMLFDRYNAREIVFDFAPTPRNGPLQDFFASLLGARPAARFVLSRSQFEAACPPLYHRTTELEINSSQWMKSQPA